MTLSLDIPEPLMSRLEAACADVPLAVLEGFAVEAYRTGMLSRAEVGQLLRHHSRWETEKFLSSHDAWPAPTAEEVATDLDNLRSARLR